MTDIKLNSTVRVISDIGYDSFNVGDIATVVAINKVFIGTFLSIKLHKNGKIITDLNPTRFKLMPQTRYNKSLS